MRDYIRPKRPLRKAEGTVRFETEPGRQLQSDRGQIDTVVGEVADQRIHGTFKETVVQRFVQEQPHLRPLPPGCAGCLYRRCR